MPTVIQGESVNLLPGIIRLTGMTAILSALSIPQGYGSALPLSADALDPADPFAAFTSGSRNNPGPDGLPRVHGLKGTIPLTTVLAMKAVSFNRFYEVTGIEGRHLPKGGHHTLLAKATKASPATEQADLTPASAEIDRFIDDQVNTPAQATVPFDEVADQVDEALDREQNPRLVVSQKNGKTTFSRDTLTIYEDQDHIQLDVDHETMQAIERGQMAVFIRNPGILTFDRAAMKLVTKGRGNTELYFVNGSQSMAIIPVAVEGVSGAAQALASAPKKLSSLNNLIAYPQQSVSLAQADKKAAARPAPVAKAKPKTKAPAESVSVAATAPADAEQMAIAALERSLVDNGMIASEGMIAGNGQIAGDDITADKLPKPSIKDTGILVASAGNSVASSAVPTASFGTTTKSPASKKAKTEVAEQATQLPLGDRVFAHSDVNWQASDITIKVGDERSHLIGSTYAKPRLFPIAGLKVQVVGSSDRSLTDTTGRVDLAEVPEGASFLLDIEDPRGKFAPAIIEVAAGTDSKEQVKLLSQKNLNLYSDLAGTIQKSWLGSACINIKGAEDDELAGMTVSANVEANGPLYFHKNLPRPNSISLDSHGRFCFFNIEPGLVELGVKDKNGQWITGFALPIFAGKHLEDEVVLGDGHLLRTQVAAVPGGDAQLGRADIALEDYALVDNADLLALGDQAAFDSSLASIHSLAPGYSSYKGQVYVLAKGADIETALYNFSAPGGSNAMPVMTALPRGFVEDLHEDLYQSESVGSVGSLYEPSLGSAVVFFGHFAKMTESVTIKLLDDRGREVNSGWYFGESFGGESVGVATGTRIKGRTPEGLSKAVFFNLNPGIYTAVVETDDGRWLDSKTLAVDFWTVSVVNAGSQIQSYPK